MINYAAKIKSIRKKLSLSQQQMAKLLGISQGALSRIESGDSYPRRKLMQKIEYLC